ncbi:MAG: hypothetical protein QXN55_00620 [Candidatus Nitrosotenuis sp.]
MATLTIFDENNTIQLEHKDAKPILARVGVTLGRAYSVDRFTDDFFIHDIIELDGNRPEFHTEHFHMDVEARWFIEGGGDFYIHFGRPVYKVECSANDFIIIPAGMKHWFDMGQNTYAKVFRGFSQENGWIATNIDAEIHKLYINRRR